MPDGSVYEPRNFTEDHLGVLSLRDGFKLSRNVIAVKLMNDAENRGIGARTVFKYTRNMGITTYIPQVPSMAIGTAEVKLIEMVSAYTIFPNFGIKTDNFAIEWIDDKNDTIFQPQRHAGEKTEVLKENVASLMVSMLRSVVREGTGRLVIARKGMTDRPSAGKTGTGQDFKDAWFIGFTPYIACGVWIGFDSEETQLKNPLHTGATAALPVWIDFIMETSELLDYQKDEFKMSNNLTTLKLCSDSYLLATGNCPEASIYTEYFIPGTEIEQFCDKHGSDPNRANDPRFSPQSQRNRRNP
ncbi:Penicillin-binding protein 1A [subsurface metagenome]